MKQTIWVIIFILLCVFAWGCQRSSLVSTSETPESPNTSPTATPIPRWMVYQTMLASKIVNSTDALCEFELLGVSDSGKEVYMWALCEVNRPDGAGGNVPAVIYLNDNGEIEKVDIPISGVNYPKDVERLFPPEIAERILKRDISGYVKRDHLVARMTVSAPPLMVVVGTPLP